MWDYFLRVNCYVLNFFLILSALIIISCTGQTTANSNSGGNIKPNPSLNVESVIIGNITPIPLNGSGANETSAIITNNLPETVYLNSATITQNGTTTDITKSGSALVNLQLCQTIQDHGTCSVVITPPNTNGNFLLSIVFKTVGGKSYTTSQVITYSNQIPSVNGFYYSTLNSNIYNYPGQSTTVTIPFRLGQTYTNLKVEGNNPSFSASYSCPGDSLTQGTLCTAHILINNLGTTNLVIGYVSITGATSTSITNKAQLNKLNFNNVSNIKTTFSAKINLNVSQNITGNLLTSAINVLVNPSTGNAQTVTLLNNGSASITNIAIIPVSPVTVTNNGAGSCNAASGTLAAGASCTFVVNITTNTNVQSSVTINYNNGASSGNTNGTLSFNVIGISATSSPGMTMTSGQGSLVGTAINTTVYYNILVANTGNVTLSNITFTDPSVYNAALSWDSTSTCPTGGTATLNVGQSCTLVIKFSPTITISSTNLTINSTAGYTSGGTTGTYNNASLAVSYSAINSVAFFYLTPNSVSYSIRADGSATQTQTYVLTNGGGTSSTVGTISISSAVTGFSILGTGTCVANTTVLAANGTCTINTQYGTVTSAQSSISRTLNVTYLPSSGSSTATSFANLTFDASTAALVSVSNVVVTNTTSGSGTSGSPYAFTNTPLSNSQITAVITYSNTGTAAATKFNVALNTLPVGYSYNSGATTCGVGSNTTTLNASSTCNVSIFAVNSSGLSNSYALTGTLNFNIPGYSYTDTSTGLNTNANPTYSAYGGNTVYVTANALASVASNSPTSSTATNGGSFNITFTASSAVAASLPLTITIPGITTTNTNLIYATTSNTCTIATSTGSCNINITNLSNAVAQTYNYNYTVSPNGSSSGITKYLSFTLN